MKRITTIIIITILGLSLTACNARPRVGAPWMQDLLNNGPENSTPKFRKGWQDGCETGISATSNNLQKYFYHFKQDYQLALDNEYYTGWKLAYNYCQRYVFQYLRRNII